MSTPTMNPRTDARIPSPFTTTLLSVIIVFLCLATIAVGLRIYCARISKAAKWFTMDLKLVIASLIVIFGCVLTTIIGAATVGLDYLNNKKDAVQAAHFIFKVYFSDVITQTVASGLCKISILEFYKRIFVWNPFGQVCNVGIFLVSSWMIGTFFTQLFSTTPISSAWHPERQLLDANYDYPTAILAIFGIGMVLDLLILCLPLRPVWEMRLTLADKIRISLILWLGVFCVVSASIRFYYSYLQLDAVFVATAQEKGTITVQATMWSIIEPSASIIAACLPTYGLLFTNGRMGALIESALSFMSIKDRTTSSPISNKDVNHINEPSDKIREWHELKLNTNMDIENSPIQSLKRPEQACIRAKSEIELTY